MSEVIQKQQEPTPMMQINYISKLFRDQMRRNADESGIPSGYRSLLMHLSHHDGITQYELARHTHLTPPTVSVTLQKMEHDGYIVRKPDQNDLRQMHVCLTEQGIELERCNRARAEELEAIALKELTEEESSILLNLLNKIADQLLLQRQECEKN